MRTLGDLAKELKAQLVGDPEIEIQDAKTTARASKSDITFACSQKHWQLFLQVDAVAAIVSKDVNTGEEIEGKSFIQVDDAEAAFEKVVRLFRPPVKRIGSGISPNAMVADSASISEDVDIHPGAYIGENVRVGCGSIIHPNVTVLDNVVIGANTTVFPGVVLYENTIVGDRCLIHGGAVIGGYGFGYKSDVSHKLRAQLGNVIVGNDVEIGCNATIDRGTYDSTVIGDGTKLDNLVMIGHNCQIGKHNLFCSQVGIAGSTVTGDCVVMAGQVGIGDHLQIGDKVVIAAQSGVMHNLASDKVYLGSPAIPVRQQMQQHAMVAKLPDLRRQIRELQNAVDELSGISNPNLSAGEAA